MMEYEDGWKQFISSPMLHVNLSSSKMFLWTNIKSNLYSELSSLSHKYLQSATKKAK